jgi:hypothetical protein
MSGAAWLERRLVLPGVTLLSILFATVSCTHVNRVSGGALERLTRNGDQFVLVFGSLSTPGGMLDHPAIRFLHPDSSGTPDALLWSTTIATDQRFYAVLHAPPSAKYLDAFYVEVGSETSGFDRIIYAHMREGQEPQDAACARCGTTALNRRSPLPGGHVGAALQLRNGGLILVEDMSQMFLSEIARGTGPVQRHLREHLLNVDVSLGDLCRRDLRLQFTEVASRH